MHARKHHGIPLQTKCNVFNICLQLTTINPLKFAFQGQQVQEMHVYDFLVYLLRRERGQ